MPGGVLSGGEQQMLTICRTLMGDPDLIMIDEPTEGLSPMMVEHVGRLLEEIARRGVAILLVEQKLTIALKISTSALRHGAREDRLRRHARRSRSGRGRFARNGWKCEREMRALHASFWADALRSPICLSRRRGTAIWRV